MKFTVYVFMSALMPLSLYHTATPGALEETFKYNAGIFIVYVFMSVLMSLSLYHHSGNHMGFRGNFQI